jgi:hypothetical protein
MNTFLQTLPLETIIFGSKCLISQTFIFRHESCDEIYVALYKYLLIDFTQQNFSKNQLNSYL